MATLLLPALLLRVPSLLLVAPLQLMSPLLLPPRTPHQNASRQSSPARVLQTVQPMAVLSRRSPIAASASKPPTDQPNQSPRVSQHLHQQRTQGCFQRCPFKGQVCRRRDCSLPTTAAPATAASEMLAASMSDMVPMTRMHAQHLQMIHASALLKVCNAVVQFVAVVCTVCFWLSCG